MLKFLLCGFLQEARLRGRKAFEVVFALCSWTASPWTWRREQRSPLEFRPDVQATAAAMARCARTRVGVWREPRAFPVTAARLLTLDPSATEVQRPFHILSTVLNVHRDSKKQTNSRLKPKVEIFSPSYWCTLCKSTKNYVEWKQLASSLRCWRHAAYCLQLYI